jgi:hypothetical protein
MSIEKITNPYQKRFKNVPPEYIMAVLLEIENGTTLKELDKLINDFDISNTLKGELKKVFNKIIVKNQYIRYNYNKYVKQLLSYLPLTKKQRKYIKYELSQINKTRLEPY